jgi:signal transduction histidine kinase
MAFWSLASSPISHLTGRAGILSRWSPYFCCLEALQNVTKHAGDRARATVALGLGDGALQFWVQDDGVGFDRNAVLEGYGLVNLRDRLEALGGEAAITSIPGRGTSVTGQIPLP